jgi:RNA polymerase primary sigma factor
MERATEAKVNGRAAKPRKQALGTPAGLTEDERPCYARIPAEIDHVPHESFAEAATEQELFGPEAERIEVPAWTQFPEAAEELPAARRRRARLKPREEAVLFLRYNYARYRLGQFVEAQLRRVSTVRARAMIEWFRRVMRTRADLVRANLPLVLAMAKRTKIPNVEFGEVVSEGNMALLRAVEKFDVSRGFKFSTYACRAILKSFNRLATKTGRYRQRFPVEYDPEMEQSDYDVNRHELERANTVETVRDILSQNRARLSDVERMIVIERFAISSRGKGRTLAEVGRMVGLTNERVRQIQNTALRKIRLALAEDLVTT